MKKTFIFESKMKQIRIFSNTINRHGLVKNKYPNFWRCNRIQVCVCELMYMNFSYHLMCNDTLVLLNSLCIHLFIITISDSLLLQLLLYVILPLLCWKIALVAMLFVVQKPTENEVSCILYLVF